MMQNNHRVFKTFAQMQLDAIEREKAQKPVKGKPASKKMLKSLVEYYAARRNGVTS